MPFSHCLMIGKGPLGVGSKPVQSVSDQYLFRNGMTCAKEYLKRKFGESNALYRRSLTT